MSVLVIGTGPIGIEYTHILKTLGVSVTAIGRSEAGCQEFEAKTGIKALSEGIEALNHLEALPTYAIVAVSEGQLGNVVDALIGKGIARLYSLRFWNKTFSKNPLVMVHFSINV